MKIKNILSGLLAVCLFTALMVACRKKADELVLPVNPVLSQPTVNMSINTTDSSVTINSGVAPYTLTVSDASKITASLSGNKLVLVAGSKTASASTPVTVTITGKDKGTVTLTITIGDPWADAKTSNIKRFEQTGASAFVPKIVNDSVQSGYNYYNIYADNGKLFGSTKPKYGWASADGKMALFLEIDGDPKTTGAKTGGRIAVRTNGGDFTWTNCASVNVIQSQSGISWIVYKLADGTQGLVVQGWMGQ